MATERELTTVYAILGRTHIAVEPYDAKSAFVLLHSITEELGDAAPRCIDVACHLHMVAALGDNELANREARRAMVRLVGALEQSLAPASR